MTELLEAGARRRAWPTPLLVLVAALGVAVWTVLAAVPPTVDGHGSRPAAPPHVSYQPVLGRPFI